jgi:hypothetical protein
MDFKQWITEGSLLRRLNKRFSRVKPPETQQRSAMFDDLKGESRTSGGKMFREWLKKREAFEATPSNVQQPTDPKEIARRKAVNDITGKMMKKNPALKPGGTDQQTVANLANSDPNLAKADADTQQSVSAFFLKQ